VRENVLYRLWPDKKAMFLASIRYVYDHSVEIWMKLLADRGRRASPAERLLDYEAVHHGEFGLYRIVFAGLSETDDADIRSALHDMYARFAGFLEQRIREHRAEGRGTALPADLTAWAVVGLGTVADICRELRRGDAALRRRLLADAGRVLLHGEPS
jgi:AcrR family transcriptional regulator